jgi:hypothetical protein
MREALMRTDFATVIVFATTCMTFAVPANADIDWSGYGELSAGIGTSTMSDRESSCQPCGYSDNSNTPTDLAGGLHVSTTSDAGLSLQFDGKANTRYLSGLQYYGYSNIVRVTKYGTGIHLDIAKDRYRVGGSLQSVIRIGRMYTRIA